MVKMNHARTSTFWNSYATSVSYRGRHYLSMTSFFDYLRGDDVDPDPELANIIKNIRRFGAIGTVVTPDIIISEYADGAARPSVYDDDRWYSSTETKVQHKHKKEYMKKSRKKTAKNFGQNTSAK